MMMADLETVKMRRSNYDPAYLEALLSRYQAVAEEFPDLVVLSSENTENLDDELATALKSHISTTDTQSITTEAISSGDPSTELR